MNQTKYVDLALVGAVQHGIQVPSQGGGKRAKELGHFIAKVENPYMQTFLQRFKEQCEGKDYIEIAFCENNPLIKKFIRYNQGGKVCHSLEGSKIAKQKVNNKWQQIECSEKCQYKQKNEQGKSVCNRNGWLRFLIPAISQDKIWLMKITGQTSINRLDAFINLQNEQGTLLENNYILFLRQEEQTSKTGQTFNNYILNIMLKKDFVSINPNSKNVENIPLKGIENEPNVVNQDNQDKTKKKEKTVSKATKNKSKKATNIIVEQNPDVDKCYYFTGYHTDKFTKDGQLKEYFIGEFCNMTDKPINFIIKPELIDILKECGIGCVFELEIEEFKDKKIATSLKLVQNNEKNIAA